MFAPLVGCDPVLRKSFTNVLMSLGAGKSVFPIILFEIRFASY
jgi:hypothetical protein